MIIFPAIDLKNGACVRLRQGDMSQATVFSDNPAAQAQEFVDDGASWLHVVDLNGATTGKQVNGSAVEAILDAINVPIQLGGGIRDFEAIESWLSRGVGRVVLGTAAIRNPELVKRACNAFPGKIAIALDARGGRVATDGWVTDAGRDAIAVAQEFADCGVAAIVYTDIDRDGLLSGVNVEATAALACAVAVPVIASGGVATLDDIRALKDHEKDGIIGVIAGRSLYDGRISLAAAIAVAA
ncbi:MAG: 1-(5-phosphoribosyl)-5-[(5-phosphoribosylamino)methylideneamino]imidazole-4-carboxamide isomerase [Proteobacteria bacterium]|nr:1-(5-phosphoribosyl)-5-[(5-phosphoribosylamino)methylideneamino]imidazole-4-carboxamide isomerase [Pseudomonadota bacterium]